MNTVGCDLSPGGWAVSDVIRFVGQIRTGYDDEDDSVAPDAAEQLILAALRDTPMPAGIDEGPKPTRSSSC